MGTILLIVAYVTVTILPMCFLQCPYRTPLCDLAYCPFIYITSLVQKHYHRLQLLQSIVGRITRINDSGSNSENNSESDSGCNHITVKPNSLKQLELEAVEKVSFRLSVEALQWLFSASSNPAVQSIVIESIGRLPMGALAEVEDVFHDSPSIVDVRGNLLSSLTGRNYYDTSDCLAKIPSGMEHKFERLLRSCMFTSGVKNLWFTSDVLDQLDRDEFGATIVTQIPKLCQFTYQAFCKPTVEYFPEMVLKYALRWLSHFVLLPDIYEILDRHLPLSWMLSKLIHQCLDLEVKPKSIWKILESVIVNTPIFSLDAADSKYDKCSSLVLDCYGIFVQEGNLASRIHAPSSALQPLVTFITTQWSTSTRTKATFNFLASCLEQHLWPAYDVFYQQQCLKFLTMQPVSSWSASLFRAYVTGIAAAIHPSRGHPEENQTISQAIDCLHEPGNLLFVCSTLAIYTHYLVYEVTGKPDIMTALAQIQPLDPAWGNCLQRFQALADAWDENCFVGVESISNQKKKLKNGDIPLQTTASLELVQLPPTLLSLDVAEESLARATTTSVSVRSHRLPALTVTTG
ncbi:hypothetical protein ARMSODRAFT_968775 [Armillaria solidipes]|uniref:Uncharacterized protein n=1 Tax=Armillaria solidipes TaxID=1076256 RepID=A0A2H3CPM0_9AGAR|nr:hypothetical protein ARMSODRAFT_968775 [Armillaria solidipes]